jgi:hypothetical protein
VRRFGRGSRSGRIAGWVVGAFVVWLVVLLIGGWVGSGCARDRVADRIAHSMQAKVTIGDASLSLIRGGFTADDLTIVKDAGGHLRVHVDHVDADLMPLGLTIFDRSIGTLRLRGIQLEASSRAVLEVRDRKRKPIAVDELIVDDVKVSLMPTALLPGLGRVDVTVEHGRAGPTVFRTALSWVFGLQELRARLDLPAGITIRLIYAGGKLSLAGGLFGDTPVEIPFEIPKLDPEREIDQLIELGKDVLKKATVGRASDLVRGVRDKIHDVIGGGGGTGAGSGSGGK